MQALQMMVGQGGWPLNVFLTPDFPVQPRFNRPGFLQVLQSVRRYYDEEKEKLSKFTVEMLGVLRQSAILPRAETNLAAPSLLATGSVSAQSHQLPDGSVVLIRQYSDGG